MGAQMLEEVAGKRSGVAGNGTTAATVTAAGMKLKHVEPAVVIRKDTHVGLADAPVLPGINAQTPGSMPRAEDDDATRAHSPEFHDRPGSGKNTADRLTYF
jgi:hypothetical protein